MALNPEMKIQPVELAPATVGTFMVANPPQLSYDPQTGRIDRVIASYIDDDNETIPVGKIVTEPHTGTAKDNIGGKVTGTGYWVASFASEVIIYEDFAHHAFKDTRHNIRSYSPEEIHERKAKL